jgi:hypothetical protein
MSNFGDNALYKQLINQVIGYLLTEDDSNWSVGTHEL